MKHRTRKHRTRKHRTRKHHSNKKRVGCINRRKTYKRGGVSNPCHDLDYQFNVLKNRAQDMTINNYEPIVSDLRSLYDEARRKGCFDLASEIDRYENNELYSRINVLHQQQ